MEIYVLKAHLYLKFCSQPHGPPQLLQQLSLHHQLLLDAHLLVQVIIVFLKPVQVALEVFIHELAMAQLQLPIRAEELTLEVFPPLQVLIDDALLQVLLLFEVIHDALQVFPHEFFLQLELLQLVYHEQVILADFLIVIVAI